MPIWEKFKTSTNFPIHSFLFDAFLHDSIIKQFSTSKNCSFLYISTSNTKRKFWWALFVRYLLSPLLSSCVFKTLPFLGFRHRQAWIKNTRISKTINLELAIKLINFYILDMKTRSRWWLKHLRSESRICLRENQNRHFLTFPGNGCKKEKRALSITGKKAASWKN